MNQHLKMLTLTAAVLVASACSRLERIEVDPKSLELTTAGQSQNLGVKGFDQNNKAMEKVEFAYTSTNPSVATVDATGKVVAVKSGSATVEISSGEKKEVVAIEVKIPGKLTLNPSPIALTGVSATVALEAKVFDDAERPIDGAKVEFAVADPTIATIKDGTLTSAAVGSTKVTATSGALKAETDLTVALPAFESIVIEPASPIAAKVGEMKFLQVSFKDAAGAGVAGLKPTFTSSDEKIAQVNEGGQVTAVAAGNATITVSLGEKSATATVSIKK